MKIFFGIHFLLHTCIKQEEKGKYAFLIISQFLLTFVGFNLSKSFIPLFSPIHPIDVLTPIVQNYVYLIASNVIDVFNLKLNCVLFMILYLVHNW
jgi:hypothetical protein